MAIFPTTLQNITVIIIISYTPSSGFGFGNEDLGDSTSVADPPLAQVDLSEADAREILVAGRRSVFTALSFYCWFGV